MAVDKFSPAVSGVPDFMTILSSRESLENSLARFDEQVARYTPEVIRKRLKKRLSNLRVNISTSCE